MPARGDRLAPVKTKLQAHIQAAIGDSSIYRKATEWGVPHYVLVDTLRGKVDCPSPKYLRQIACGLEVPVETVIEEAYSSNEPVTA